MKNYIPLNFEAHIGGYMGHSYAVEMISPNQIRYITWEDHMESRKEQEFGATEESWEIFRKSLEKAKVFEWKDRYVDKNILDGTQWSINIKFPDTQKEISGNNAYPDEKDFNAFLAAVSILIKNNTFQ